MSYPEYANIDGERYKINTDFRVALRCFEVVDDATICDEERALAVIYLLFGFIPEAEKLGAFLDKARLFLQCGETTEQQAEKKANMSLTHDRGYINASFMSDYRIDLNTAQLHFWQFVELIQGLTENSALSRLRELRDYDLSTIKDAKSRSKIAKAQAQVALPVQRTRDELEAWDEFERLFAGEETHG